MRTISRLLIGVLGLLMAAWLVVVVAIYAYGRRDNTRPADAIVVLGAAQYDGRPSPVLQARLDHAVELYRRGVAERIITTGGTAPGDTVSEAVAARRYAVRQGIPADAILTERSGQRSSESIAAVAGLLDARGLRSAVLVSDPFHMLRLRLIAGWHGIDAHTSPTRSSPISRNPREEWRHMVRESFGLPLAILEEVRSLRPSTRFEARKL